MYKPIGVYFLTKEQRNCPHPDNLIVSDWDGRFRFDGEPWDDIRERLFCGKCGAEVKLIQKKHQKKMEVIPI